MVKAYEFLLPASSKNLLLVRFGNLNALWRYNKVGLVIMDERRGVKWPSIRRMVKKQQVDMICIQETKKESIEKSMCQALWGEQEVNWEAQPASNIAGGILCIW